MSRFDQFSISWSRASIVCVIHALSEQQKPKSANNRAKRPAAKVTPTDTSSVSCHEKQAHLDETPHNNVKQYLSLKGKKQEYLLY